MHKWLSTTSQRLPDAVVSLFSRRAQASAQQAHETCAYSEHLNQLLTRMQPESSMCNHVCNCILWMYSIFYWMHLFDCPFFVRSGFAAAHKQEMFGWHGPVSYPSLVQSQESLIELVWYIWLSLLFSLAPTPSFLGHAHHRERDLGLHPPPSQPHPRKMVFFGQNSATIISAYQL